MSRMLSKMNLISVVQQLPKEDIETIQGYVEMIENENRKLLNDYCRLDARTKTQQKEFIKCLEDEIKDLEKSRYVSFNEFGNHKLYFYKEVLSKYKEIIGSDVK